MLKLIIVLLSLFLAEATLQSNSSSDDSIYYENFKAVFEKLGTEIQFLQDKVKLLEQRNSLFLEELTRIASERSSHRSNRNIGDSTTQVAFYARSDNLGDLGKDQIILFKDEVYTNIGNLYNAHTGVFYCDVAGTYVFFVRILSERGHDVRAYLSRNGSDVAILSAPNAGSYLGSDSNMAILQLQRGDSIAVRSLYPYSGNVIDAWSTFSGFLLYPAEL